MPGYFTPTIRRRLAPLVLVAGAAIVGKLAFDTTPREQEVRLLLEGEQREARAVSISYTREGEEIMGVMTPFPSGAPATFIHQPQLSPGAYDLAIELSYRDGRIERLNKTLTVPSEGAVRIPLDGRR